MFYMQRVIVVDIANNMNFMIDILERSVELGYAVMEIEFTFLDEVMVLSGLWSMEVKLFNVRCPRDINVYT